MDYSYTITWQVGKYSFPVSFLTCDIDRERHRGRFHYSRTTYNKDLVKHLSIYFDHITAKLGTMFKADLHGLLKRDEGITPQYFLNLPKQNVFLHGYFSHYSFWEKYEREIREMFIFSTPIKEKAESYIQKVKNKIKNDKRLTIIGIHVRRGDFLKEKKSTHYLMKTFQKSHDVLQRKIFDNILCFYDF